MYYSRRLGRKRNTENFESDSNIQEIERAKSAERAKRAELAVIKSIEYVDSEELERDLLNTTNQMNDKIADCLQSFARESVQLFDADIFNETIGREFPTQVKQFQKLYDGFIDRVKDRVCKCFAKNLNTLRENRKNILCLSEKFTDWSEFRELLGFPCSLFKDKSLWEIFQQRRPTLVMSKNLREKFENLCNCIVSFLKKEYSTPKELFLELEWGIAQSSHIPIADKMYRVIDKGVNECFITQPICSSDTLKEIENYIIENRSYFWPTLKNFPKRMSVRLDEMKTLLKLICRVQGDLENRHAPNFNQTLRHFTRDASKSMMEKVRNFRRNPAFTPLQVQSQEAPRVVEGSLERFDGAYDLAAKPVPNSSTNTSKLAGDMNLPSSDVETKQKHFSETFCSFPF